MNYYDGILYEKFGGNCISGGSEIKVVVVKLINQWIPVNVNIFPMKQYNYHCY